MKKLLCITGLILILSFLVIGCASRPQEHPDGGEDATMGIPTGTDPDDQVDTGSTTNVTSVTREDLDKLKADIEGLEAEDLGGLSND